MISSKSLKYTVRILLGTLIGVYLGIIVLLNIPYVQGKLSVFVTKELKNILNTEVSVGRIDMGLHDNGFLVAESGSLRLPA